MRVHTVINELMESVPRAVAAGLVELNTGLLLGVRTHDSHPQEILELVALATHELYQGDKVLAIEHVFNQLRDNPEKTQYFQEFVIFSTNLLHIFGRLKCNRNIAGVVVCPVGANLGMAYSKARQVFENAQL
ncbi:MAG: hypothetical protein GMKNLPBB_02562 [Myxococcota bacterium]|nr:hypothetical protein [Myxococcota bacterium]